jgi:NDP-4-keto-2,6-dideoxyhexose 3-C-methyltransferase
MPMKNKITRCRICGNTALAPVLNLGDQSLTGVFPKTPDEKITTGPLELLKCQDDHNANGCGLLQLSYSYDQNEMYGNNYGYRSGINRSMVSHLKELADKITDIVNLQKDDVMVDIGSNDGTFLGLFVDRCPTLIGIDPTIPKFSKYYHPQIIQSANFFSADLVHEIIGRRRAKVVTTIAMFYDLEDPLAFARQVFAILDENGIWVLEQSYVLLMLRQNAYDTICHEHLEYYALKQLKWILDQVGFKIIDIEYNDTNGGSFKLTTAKKSSIFRECTALIEQALIDETNYGLNSLSTFETFRINVEQHRRKLVALIQDIHKQGKTVLGYGASTKGNVILQYCRFTRQDLPCIAEVNEDKFGLYTPQTLIPIISEARAKARNPDYFLVFPWHFKSNFIVKEADYLNRGGQFIFPLPQIAIVSRTRD